MFFFQSSKSFLNVGVMPMEKHFASLATLPVLVDVITVIPNNLALFGNCITSQAYSKFSKDVRKEAVGTKFHIFTNQSRFLQMLQISHLHVSTQ